MKEEFLYYLWENKLLTTDLFTTEGDTVEIVSVGVRNRDSGPDYCDAKVRVGDVRCNFVPVIEFDTEHCI